LKETLYFHEKPESRVFLSTDAGGVGLNLQCANVVINLDIPWNPAILEQRIARVHRLGQGKHVRVINFVTSGTIEERILHLLSFKKSVFDGVLDNGDDQVFLSEDRFQKIMNVIGNITEPPIEQTEIKKEELSEKETYEEIVEEKEIENKIAKEQTIENTDQNTHAKSLNKHQSEQQTVQDLFVSGIDFLQKLSKTFSDTNSTKTFVSSLIKKDESTGKMSINIPIQDEKIIEKAVNVLDTFLQMLKQK